MKPKNKDNFNVDSNDYDFLWKTVDSRFKTLSSENNCFGTNRNLPIGAKT